MQWEYAYFRERKYFYRNKEIRTATDTIREEYELSDVPDQCRDYNEVKKYFYETRELLTLYGERRWELVSVVYQLEIQTGMNSAYSNNHMKCFYFKRTLKDKEEKMKVSLLKID